jgi:hypothetical protein
MEFAVKFYKKAYREYFDAYDWYDGQLPGLGDRFEKMVQRQIKFIVQNPLIYPNKKFDTKESKVEDFPYLIVYKIYPLKQVIYIVSIFHTSRRPSKKYRK